LLQLQSIESSFKELLSAENYYFNISCIHFSSQWDHHVERREEIIYREIKEWDKKLVTFIKDVMKDVLISLTMSSSDDLFASKSLTIECVLSSNEISYSLKLLIDIKAADYLFINEVITQIVYDQLQIKSLTLIKAKSIQEFNNHYAKKLITHVIYLNLTVQNHTIDTAFILITWLNQHQMILEKI